MFWLRRSLLKDGHVRGFAHRELEVFGAGLDRRSSPLAPEQSCALQLAD